MDRLTATPNGTCQGGYYCNWHGYDGRTWATSTLNLGNALNSQASPSSIFCERSPPMVTWSTGFRSNDGNPSPAGQTKASSRSAVTPQKVTQKPN